MKNTMQIAICNKSHHISIHTRRIPALDERKVLIKVNLCGICGSDLAVWKGIEKRYPYSPGHELVGMVHQTGACVEGLYFGQRVVVDPNLGCGNCNYCSKNLPNLCDYLKTRAVKSNGGFSEYVALDYRMVHLVPPALSDKLATYVEPLSCALHLVNTAELTPDDTAAIFGGGILGILTGLVVASKGGRFFFVEPHMKRRKQLTELFNVSALSPTKLGTSEIVTDTIVAFECSGSLGAVAQAISILKKTGTLVLAGLAKSEETRLPLDQITKKELHVKGAWLNPNTFDKALEMAVNWQDLLNKLKTKIFSLSEIQQAFEYASSKAVNRVLIHLQSNAKE